MYWDNEREVREVKWEHCGEFHRGEIGMTWGPLKGCGILAGVGRGNHKQNEELCRAATGVGGRGC